MAMLSKVLIAITSIIYVHGQDSDDDATTSYQNARATWDSINEYGCYEYQYSQSCFCLTCFTQSMDIKVSNNQVQQVTYAEGNDFALDYFCGGNQDYVDSVLSTMSRTIDDLFDLIQDAIDRDLPFSATYNDKIGIPLTLYIDRVPGAIYDEVWYNINCLKFDTKCGKGKKGKIKKFNEKNDYSCSNIEIPDECPLDRFECNRFYDGCNTCSCNGRDPIGCTTRVCDDYNDERCFDCESNTMWDECGNICDPTCDDTDNLCGIRFIKTPDCTEPRCQCPDSLPRWDGAECVTVEECPESSIIGQAFCVANCGEYTDGCMTCECDLDGNAVSCDKPGLCKIGFLEDATCNKCMDEDTMTYTTCGGCDRTCDDYLNDVIPICTLQCRVKCECNKDTPLLLPDEGRCISEDECKLLGKSNNLSTIEPESTVQDTDTTQDVVDDLGMLQEDVVMSDGGDGYKIFFVILFVIGIIVFGGWMFGKLQQGRGYEKIGSKKNVMSVRHELIQNRL